MTYPATFRIDIKFFPNDKGSPAGKVSDAELHFAGGPLDGLKLVGFSVWERRHGTGHNVTFPARQYSVNGERRSYALLRPIMDNAGQDRIRDLILDAWREHAAALDTIAKLETDTNNAAILAQIMAPETPAPAPSPAIDFATFGAAIVPDTREPEPAPAPAPDPTPAPVRRFDMIQQVRAELSAGKLNAPPPPFQLFA